MKAKTVKRLAILIAVLGLIGGTGFYTHKFDRTDGPCRDEKGRCAEARRRILQGRGTLPAALAGLSR